MADAVKRIWPDAKLTIGPPIETGFYYDFDIEHHFSDEDLVKLEKLMGEIVAADLPVQGAGDHARRGHRVFQRSATSRTRSSWRRASPRASASRCTRTATSSTSAAAVTCKSTGEIKAFKLLSVAGAYWRGDSKNKMLQRIYGTAFPDKKALAEYVKQREEAEKRDHRKLGKELGLFAFHPLGAGRGVLAAARAPSLYTTLQSFMRKLLLDDAGYVEVKTPLLYNKKLWEQSGHWEHYADNMFKVDVGGAVASASSR